MPYKREFVWCQWCFRNLTKHGYKRHLASRICTARRAAAELKEQGWVLPSYAAQKDIDDVPGSVSNDVLYPVAEELGLRTKRLTAVPYVTRGPLVEQTWTQAWVYDVGALVWADANRVIAGQIRELLELGPDSKELQALRVRAN